MREETSPWGDQGLRIAISGAGVGVGRVGTSGGIPAVFWGHLHGILDSRGRDRGGHVARSKSFRGEISRDKTVVSGSWLI